MIKSTGDAYPYIQQALPFRSQVEIDAANGVGKHQASNQQDGQSDVWKDGGEVLDLK